MKKMCWKLAGFKRTADKTLDKNSINLSKNISNAVQCRCRKHLPCTDDTLYRLDMQRISYMGNVCMQLCAIEICKFTQANYCFFLSFAFSTSLSTFSDLSRASLRFIHSIHRAIIYTAVHEMYFVFFSSSLSYYAWRNRHFDVA